MPYADLPANYSFANGNDSVSRFIDSLFANDVRVPVRMTAAIDGAARHDRLVSLLIGDRVTRDTV